MGRRGVVAGIVGAGSAVAGAHVVAAALLGAALLAGCALPAPVRTTQAAPTDEQALAANTAGARTGTLVLPYAAFGPQAMAWKSIGFEWFQWNSSGGPDPLAPPDDIRVVVYRGLPLAEVQRLYPVVAQRQDYRYFAHADALAYLDENTAAAQEEGMDGLAQDLRETRARIVGALGPRWPVAPGSAQ